MRDPITPAQCPIEPCLMAIGRTSRLELSILLYKRFETCRWVMRNILITRRIAQSFKQDRCMTFTDRLKMHAFSRQDRLIENR